MAVVNTLSDLYADRVNDVDPPNPHRLAGRPVNAVGSVSNGASDSTASTYRLGSVPSNGYPHEDTFFDVTSWGFAQIVIGTQDDTTALVNQTKATENMVTPIAAGDANHGNQWWEVLGMASDPGGFIDIYAHAAAGATGAGSMDFRLTTLSIK